MTPKSPLISVIVPVCNREHLLLPTLQSIAAQSYRPIEVVVVDDGSTDQTAASAAAALETLKLRGKVTTIENRGPAGARDHAFSVARGEFLAPLDSDDLWEPSFLETMCEAMALRQDAGMAFSDFVLFYEDGKEITKSQTLHLLHKLRMLKLAEDVFLMPDDLFAFLLQEQPIFPSCTIMRRSFYELIGPYTQAISRRGARSVEWEFFLRAARKAPIVYVKKPLSRIRKHSGNISGVTYLQVQATVEILDLVLRTYELSDAEREIAERQVSSRSWEVGYGYLSTMQLKTARSWLAKSLSYRASLTVISYYLLTYLPPRLFEALRAVKRVFG